MARTTEFGQEIQSPRESVSRPERVMALMNRAEELFPGEENAELRVDIRRSLDVPQLGLFHHEGRFMDAHVAAILDAIDQIKKGRFPNEVPPEVRALLQRVVQENEGDLARYAFLHDLAKPDCLRITRADGSREEPTWENWIAQIPEGAQDDLDVFDRFCEKQGITQISYYQPKAKRNHGAEAAESLRASQESLGLPGVLITAVKNHEITHQFGQVSAREYEKRLGLDENKAAWVITACYLDTMASQREDDQPELTNFKNMVDSAHNLSVVRQVQETLCPDGQVPEGLDPKKVESALDELRRRGERIPTETGELTEQLLRGCEWSTYDPERLGKTLAALEMTGVIPEGMGDKVVNLVGPDGKMNQKGLEGLRRKLGRANKEVNQALEVAEIRKEKEEEEE